MAGYPYRYGSRYTTNTRDSNEVNISSLETQLSDLTSLVIQLVCKETQQVRRSGAYTNNAYLTNRYPISQYHIEEAYAFGGFSSQCHGPPELYSSTYTQRWQPHPYINEYDYSWYDPSYPSYESTPPTTQSYSKESGMPLEDIVKSLALSTLEFQQETRACLQNLENQISQHESSIRRLEVQIEEKLGSRNKKKLEISLDEEECTNLSTSRDVDKKGDDVIMLEQMVATPPVPTPLFNLIKEDEFVNIGRTLSTLEKPKVDDDKWNPNEVTFAKLNRLTTLEGKGPTLEIRTDFKTPQRHVKAQIWGIDLLDTG